MAPGDGCGGKPDQGALAAPPRRPGWSRVTGLFLPQPAGPVGAAAVGLTDAHSSRRPLLAGLATLSLGAQWLSPWGPCAWAWATVWVWCSQAGSGTRASWPERCHASPSPPRAVTPLTSRLTSQDSISGGVAIRRCCRCTLQVTRSICAARGGRGRRGRLPVGPGEHARLTH